MARRKRHLTRHLEPKYVVNIDLKALDLPKAGVAMVLKVKDRTGLLLGTAEIGQGSFGWRPANKQKFERIEWDKLGARLDGRG
jgi:hypothetical protein